MIGQEDYSLPPWEAGDREGWAKRNREAMKRGRSNFLAPDLSQREIPLGNETVIRLATTRSGERYQHFFNDPTDPENGLTSANCCAPPDFKGPRDDVCPICAYAKNRGGRDEGGADVSHNYYLLVITGKFETVVYKSGPDDPGTRKPEIVWDLTPKVFECGGGIFNGIFKYQDIPDFPPGANGDITRFAFRVEKKKTGSAAMNVQYDVIPIPTLLEPVKYDVEQLKAKWEHIRKMCQPTKQQDAAEKLGVQVAPQAEGMPTKVEKATEEPRPTGSSAMPHRDNPGHDFELEPPPGSSPAINVGARQVPPPDAEEIF